MPTARKSLFTLPILLITLFLFSAAVSAASAKTGIITGDIVNLRANPDLSSKILAQLEKGKQVSVLDSKGEWFKVSYNDTTGWINDNYLVLRDQTTSAGMVSANSVNVRAKPELSADILAKLDKGTKVDVYERSGDWYRISIGEERFGWVNGEYLSVRSDSVSRGLTTDVQAPVTVDGGNTDTAIDESPDDGDTGVTKGNEEENNEDGAAAEESDLSKTRQDFVAYAKKFIGVRYVYGASSPKGFDCSGFVSYVYKHFGITLERASRDMGKGGKAINKDELQPGDLVFFDTNGGLNGITHVGMYIGNGKFIHASSNRSHRRVMISSLNESYYKARFMRARDYLSE